MTLPTETRLGLSTSILDIGNGEAAEGYEQFITFRIEAEEYGVSILSVREIKAWTAVTSLPNAPEFVRGVINLRGVILPVFDLRCRFGMGLTEPSARHVIIIVWTGAKLIGLLVDQVAEIIALSDDDIRPVPEMGFSIDDEFLDGLAAIDNRMVALIDVEKLFDMETIIDGMKEISDK